MIGIFYLIIPVPDKPDSREPVHTRKHQIEYSQIRLFFPHQLQSLLRRFKSQDLIAIALQRNFHKIPDILIVLNNKYFLHDFLSILLCC